MSNDIYKILNNFNKLTEQKPQPTEQKAAAKPKTQLQESIEQVNEKYMGFKKTVAAIKKGGSAENPEAVAAAIGRKKYGKEKFQKAAAAGKKLNEMDKSQPSSDRGGESSGDPNAKGAKATPVKSKDMATHSAKTLNKSMAKAHKKDVKEQQQGVAEAAKWRDPKYRGVSFDYNDSYEGPGDARPGKLPLTRSGQRDLAGSARMQDPLAAREFYKKDTGRITTQDIEDTRDKNFGKEWYREGQDVAESERQPGRFSGAWQILVNGKKVHSFRGNFDQETADRVGVVKAASRGLYNPDSGDKIKVVPVMLDQKQDVAEGSLNEKAVSRAQQKFMGMVHAAQKGDEPASPEVAKVAKGMSKKAAKDYASTKHKGLPQHVNETIIKALKEGYTKEQIVQYILENADKEYWKDLMKDVPDKGTVSKTVHKGHYGTEYQGDSDEDDDGQTKKIAKPEGEKRGRGRPKGVKNRVVRAGEKKATAPAGEKRGRGRPPGSKNKMRESWIEQNNSMIAEAYTKLVEKELGQTYRADRMPNIPAPVPTDPTWIKDPKTGEYKPDVPKPAPAPKPAAPKGTEKRSDIEGDTAVAEMMRLAGMEGKLHGGQHKLDVDKDGDIEADDLADLRAGKKVEETEQPKVQYTANEIVSILSGEKTEDEVKAARAQHSTNTPSSSVPGSTKYTPKYPDLPNKAGGINSQGVPIKEFDMEEGNEFSGALDAARDAGEKEFEVDGRTYPVKESQLDECGEMGPMANGMGAEQEGKMNVSTHMSSDGTKSVTVTADGEAAVELMQMLALAGMKQPQQTEVYMETSFKPAADTENAARDAEEQRKRTQAKLKDAAKAGEQGPKAKKDELKGVKEEKDSRYEANTTPEEEVLPLDVQLKGGDGDVAGKEKQMNANGSARFSDNPLAVKESMTAKLMREYEAIKVKK